MFTSKKVEFENDGMEPSKRYSLISLFFILKCLSKTLVIRIVQQYKIDVFDYLLLRFPLGKGCMFM